MSYRYTSSLAEAHKICAQRIREALGSGAPESSRAPLEKSLTVHEQEAKR